MVLNEKQRLNAHYRDAIRGGFRGTFAEWLLKFQKVETTKPTTKQQVTAEQKEETKKARQIQEKIRWNAVAGKK